MAEPRDKNLVRGLIMTVAGIVLALVGALWAHVTGADEVNSVGVKIFTFFPRGWLPVLIGQLISLAGIFLAMGGITLAYLYEKKMTWARAAVGAFLFTAMVIILFGIVPNEWLTYTQAEWQWTDQKLWVQIPSSLVGGNTLNISAAAFKDIINATYVVAAIAAIGIVMIRYQKRDEIRAAREKKKVDTDAGATSAFGRTVRKAER